MQEMGLFHLCLQFFSFSWITQFISVTGRGKEPEEQLALNNLKIIWWKFCIGIIG